MQKIEEIISDHLFFKDLKKQQIDSLIKCAKFEIFDANKYILNAKEEANQFYLILDGMVNLQLFSHEKGLISFEIIEEGEFVGWSWLFPPYKWRFDVKTIEKTKVISFDTKALLKIFEQDTDLGYKMHRLFSQLIIERLQALRFKFLDVLFKFLDVLEEEPKIKEINIIDINLK